MNTEITEEDQAKLAEAYRYITTLSVEETTEGISSAKKELKEVLDSLDETREKSLAREREENGRISLRGKPMEPRKTPPETERHPGKYRDETVPSKEEVFFRYVVPTCACFLLVAVIVLLVLLIRALA